MAIDFEPEVTTVDRLDSGSPAQRPLAYPTLRVALLWAAFAVGCFVFGMVTGPSLPPPVDKLLIGLLLSALMLGASALLLKGSPLGLADIGAAVRRASSGRLLIGMTIGFALVAVHVGSVLLIAGGGLSFVRLPEVGVAALLSTAAAYLAMSAAEELAFRGYSLRVLSDRYGLFAAQILIAIAFALFHRYIADYSWKEAILGTMPGSFLFAMAAVASRGLAVPIGLHAAWNLGTCVVGEKPQPGLFRIEVEADALTTVQQFAPVSYWLVLALGFVGFWIWWRRTRWSPSEVGSSYRPEVD